MTDPATDTSRATRVAIVGAGPSGFYTAGILLAHDDRPIEVDIFERLPTPWGLVRSGVAPDHPKIKSVTRIYEKTAADPRCRFYGNVELGSDVHRDELLERYDAVVYTVGAETDRPLAVPGADLDGCWPATQFVGWYNGHPDHRQHAFDLSCKRAVVIGNGNVAIDAARILCLSHDELRATDIADHALDALRESRIEEVILVGRRGPVQASFTTPELRELGEMRDADVVVDPAELELDAASRGYLDEGAKPTVKRNMEVLQEFGRRTPRTDVSRRIVLRFLRSPLKILGNQRVESVLLARNELVTRDDGSLAARATDVTETLDAGLVLTSIGYRGRGLPEVPFDEASGTIPNERGRVIGGEREYVAGWIKRGPSGIIGTNKKCAQDTVDRLLADLDNAPSALRPSAETTERWLRERQPAVVTQQGWAAIDRHERALGEPAGRPRVKLTTVPELLHASVG